ncbi:GNAT family N-acetyltransferase [Niveibacterium umoris]|uniref:Putative GNAT family acetyltransferase n=1 Tax=Niveibacterium umoris TaxID=1193620 RepID=A0A840BPW5_9RHOO|nr:GNAT family N-acetyltransferase [Niveibacterium umoris]MBB4013568.1 putative GNAT family acetyltransferase [Niveibacterium umoris]
MHPPDQPVWASLTTHHAALSLGGPLARRFAPDVNVFAAARDNSPDALAALAELTSPGAPVYVIQTTPVAIPPGCVALKEARGVQMLATRDLAPLASMEGIDILTDEDAPEMLALAQLTEPGPFLPRTHCMGRFIGVRVDGRLVAMAGERMRLPGYTEVSGVCTHPDARGQGLARRLSTAVGAAIQARGEQAFLHAWRSNQAAIALYESLGFEIRTEMFVAVIARNAA